MAVGVPCLCCGGFSIWLGLFPVFVYGAWGGEVAFCFVEFDEDGFYFLIGASPKNEVPSPVDGFVLVWVVGEFFVPQCVGEVYDFRSVRFGWVLGFIHLRTPVVRHASGCVE